MASTDHVLSFATRSPQVDAVDNPIDIIGASLCQARLHHCAHASEPSSATRDLVILISDLTTSESR